MSDQREQQIADLVTPVVAESGADIEFVTLRRAGRRTVVVVAVDADGGVSLDAVADLSRKISVALDETDVMGESAYTLEVTSPGVHRPLTLPRHWRRAASRLVRVTGTDAEVFEGRVVDSDDTAVRLDVNGHVREVPYEQVAKAVVQVEFPKEAL
ncbi:MAG: ribosome maturation factor RimP [Candidatus Nanopelagicales bacterium]|jgi:ribosome maturation factor RimP|nr:ribosome maturation factor RimP [Candidatus Nanopelagicales bacterium]MCU0296295.1 ribosome maturation factor RimP [Candidatus Nanopelagicales bacterium]